LGKKTAVARILDNVFTITDVRILAAAVETEPAQMM
jgi:hypothetical protein